MKKEIIQALKERAKEMLKDDYSRKIGDEELYTIICEWENVLSELETKRFQLYLSNEELENALKKLETYKKIAEKLAEKLDEITEEVAREKGIDDFEFCNSKCHNEDNYIECKQCIIDWARKEVEK